jgi:hypothetical protein
MIFYIEHITNAVTSVKKVAEQDGEAIIIPKMKSLSLVRTKGSDRRLPIRRYPDRESKFSSIDDVFRG